MSLYLTLKWLHILSSVVLVGTGFGSAYFLFFANRSKDLAAQAVITRLVVRADWWFTTPAIVLQPTTGLMLAHMAGIPLGTPWLCAAIILFVLAGACWLPVVWIQIQLQALAQKAHHNKSPLPPNYWRLARVWEWLGYPAFVAMVAVFYLMVAKPALWA